jgi:O-antigen ligase
VSHKDNSKFRQVNFYQFDEGIRVSKLVSILCFFIFLRVFFDGDNKKLISFFDVNQVLTVLFFILCVKYMLVDFYSGIVLFLFLIFIFVSACFALDKWGTAGLQEVFRTLSILCIFVLYRFKVNFKEFIATIVTIIVASVLSSIYSIISLIQNHGLVIDQVVRFPGLMAHPNSAALLLAFSISMQVAFRANFGKYISKIALVLNIIALLITLSFAGIMTLLVTLLVFSFSRRKSLLLFFRNLLFASCAIILSYFFVPGFAKRVSIFSNQNTFQTGAESNSLEWRFGRWNELLAIWRREPLFGQGFGSSTSGEMLRGGFLPHSEYVRILVEVGIFGLVFFGAFVLILANRIYLNLKFTRDPFAQIGSGFLLASLLNALTENTFLYSVNGVCLACLLGWVSRRTPNGPYLPFPEQISKNRY